MHNSDTFPRNELAKLYSQGITAGLWIRIHFFRIRIRIQSLMLETNTDPDTDPDPIQYGSRALMTKNFKKITAENFFIFFFLSKTAIYLSLGLHKVLYVQVIEEAFSSQKRPSNTSTFVGHFCPPGSGSGFRIRIRIRIQRPD